MKQYLFGQKNLHGRPLAFLSIIEELLSIGSPNLRLIDLLRLNTARYMHW